MLDDEAKSRTGNAAKRDSNFCDKVNSLVAATTTAIKPLGREKERKERFVLRHFAGEITYTAEGFTTKNNDALNKGLEGLLRCTKGFVPIMLGIAGSVDASKAAEALPTAFTSVSRQFTQQVNALVRCIEDTSTHFIRCIKPFGGEIPGHQQQVCVRSQAGARGLDRRYVQRQLEVGGMPQVVELMQRGFPCRVSYKTLWDMFSDLMDGEASSITPVVS